MIKKIVSELQEGINLPKCRKCGCMKETLEFITSFSSKSSEKELFDLKNNSTNWLKQMGAIKYACLGCEHCYPAVAMNVLNEVFPESTEQQTLSCSLNVNKQSWPFVVGEYSSFCDGKDCSCPVAVTTLASTGLADELAKNRPDELCIVGKTETENIGIDKVIKNIISNRTIKFLIVAGKEAQGHFSGNALLSLWKNGVDENMKIVGAHGKRPILKNVNREEVEAFRKQVNVIDMIGCEDSAAIIDKVREVAAKCEPQECSCNIINESHNSTLKAVIKAVKSHKVEMDKAGYFVIVPLPDRGIIVVEHYSYENKLLRTIEGKNAKSIYCTIIENKWITLLSHCAYLGKELERAELSIQYGFKYVQGGA